MNNFFSIFRSVFIFLQIFFVSIRSEGIVFSRRSWSSLVFTFQNKNIKKNEAKTPSPPASEHHHHTAISGRNRGVVGRQGRSTIESYMKTHKTNHYHQAEGIRSQWKNKWEITFLTFFPNKFTCIILIMSCLVCDWCTITTWWAREMVIALAIGRDVTVTVKIAKKVLSDSGWSHSLA